ncbi:hypothetical protein F5I97DRAFT_1803998 [Phlebopus sp. FC_14]|nr:hypothetical protein F5I97DRAFT_1803998 [Phlebopus sp. FC_14]
MRDLGLRAVVINNEMITSVLDEGRNLLDKVWTCKWQVSLWSPKKLISHGADMVLHDETYCKNIVLYGVNKVHVVDHWGQSFRTCYCQIGLVHQRLLKNIPIIGLLTTVVLGSDGDHFHDILWALDDGEKVVIYCRTIELVFCVAVYLWSSSLSGSARLKMVQVWYLLMSSEYNQETLDLFTNNADTRVIVTTVAFRMGMNLKDIKKIVNLEIPDLLSNAIQQKGQAGRDLQTAAVGYTFVGASIMMGIQCI